MEKTDVLIFDVGLGQSIFVYPHSHPDYGMLVDCGNLEEFEPIDFLIKKDYVTNNTLSNLTLTNYDQDHFSGLPHLREKVRINTVRFAKNLSTKEIIKMKEETTEALEHMCEIKEEYINPVEGYNPPYITQVFSLEKQHLETPDTNNLSQVVFIEQYGSVICISGDLEETGWKILMENFPKIKEWLHKTNIFVASHHGRASGYCADVFSHCKPECIIISDKGIIHDTQRDMCSIYGNCIQGQGVYFKTSKRKVLTTRDDGHIWVQLLPGGERIYRNFTHE